MKAILKWQYDQLVKELLLLQAHEVDRACPCRTEGELCVRKHLFSIEAYAEETYPIESDERYRKKLLQLSSEALMHRHREEMALCGLVQYSDITEWSRTWRKEFESYCLACENLKSEQQKAA